MGRVNRRFSIEFKQKVVSEIQAGVLSMAQAIREYQLSYNLIYSWIDQSEHGRLSHEPTYQGALENKIAQLERMVGQQAMEIELLKKVSARQAQERNGRPSVLLREAPSNGGAK